MKRFYHLLLSGLLLCLAAGVGAQPLSVSVGEASGPVGSQVCVDLTGRNWDDISAFSFSLLFDPAVLQYEDDATSGSLLGTAINFNVPASTPNAVRTVWNLFFATEGYTDAGPFTIGTVCFTVLEETETQLTIVGMPIPITFSRPDNSQIDDAVVSGGIINGGTGGATCNDGVLNGQEQGVDCGGPACSPCLPDPTCDDDVQNGNETGVDCGGPDCPPCDTGDRCGDGILNGQEQGVDCGGPDCAPCGGNDGGPDLSCGQGTDNLVLCLGDACNVDQNGSVCLAITAGNFTDISAFQADIDFPAGQLFYQSITTSHELSNNITVNVQNAGKIRLLFFQPDQSGNTVGDGTIVATVCFTNQTAAVTGLSFSLLTARDNNGNAVAIEGNGGSVNDCGGVTPTCSDGLLNGNETGVDCGGPDCAACPATPNCSDGVMNGQETGIDCGGPDCGNCNTTGGPDLDCGNGTSNLTLCFGDACNVPVNGTACLDVTVGNFTAVTAFQADVIANAGQLTFSSWTDAGALSHPIIANTATGVPRLLFFQPDQSGNTVADAVVIGTVCFTNLTAGPAVAQLGNLTARNNEGNTLNISGSSGSVNDCGTTTTPTCTDGIQNGQETGVDCGGPDCAACPPVTGGPDLACGAGTTDASFCFGDACNIPVSGTVCLDITVGNFEDITAFQADIITNASQLAFLSFTDAGALSNPINSSLVMGVRRLLFFQPDQSGVTVADGTVVGTVCFTNLNGGVSTADLQNLSARDNDGAALPTTSGIGTVNDCASMGPTCNDGVQNGNETGVDCGGDCQDCVTVCGQATTDVEICLGDVCGDAGAEVCLPVFIGNFNDLAGFQLALAFAEDELTYNEAVASTALGQVFQVTNPNDGHLIVQWNDVSTAGKTLPADTPLFEVCFTAQTSNESTVSFLDPAATLRAFDEFGATVPSRAGSNGTVNGSGCATSGPTCNDGMQNGSETGVDCGGPDCADCPDPTDDLTVVIGSATGGVGQEVCVAVTTANFENIVGFQFATTYASDRIQFGSATSTGVLNGLILTNPNPGEVRALWTDPATNPASLPDGTVLYDVCFEVIQACQTPLVIEDVPMFPVQFTNGMNQTVNPVETDNGVINNGAPCDLMPPNNLVLDIGDASGGVGQEVCVDLAVQHFTALTNATFSVTYDADVLSFAQANNFGLTSITAADVNGTTPGQITFDWDASISAGQSIADDGVLLSLCFSVDALVATNVNFANSPTVISARNGNGQNVGVIPSGGRINPDVPVIDGMTIDIGDVTAALGTNVCLPLIVFDPQPLVGFQFTIAYDPAILEYRAGNHVFAFATGFLNINPTSPGILQVGWDDPTAQQQTLPNGGTLFNVCFDLLSVTPTLVSIEDAPTAIGFFQDPDVVDVDLLPGNVNGTDAPMIIRADVSNPSCFGDADGSIGLNVTGSGNLTYVWSPNVSSGSDADDLPAGTYSVTVTNSATGQSDAATYTLSTLPFGIEVAEIEGVSCNGASDGSLTIQAIGGASPFIIDWSGSLQDGRFVQDELDGGSYSVTVTDNNGCSMSLPNINIGEPDELDVTGTPFDIEGDAPGGVNIIVQGGRPGYMYAWTGPNGYASVQKDIANAVDAGTYCVTVTDRNTCTDVQCFAVNASLGAGIVVNPGCADEDNASIDITPIGGNEEYSYEWRFGGSIISVNQDVDGLAPGDYTVIITSGSEQVTLIIGVDVIDPVGLTGSVANATDGNNGTITITPTGGNPPYTYAWADGPTTQNRTGLTSSEYCVTVTDASECTAAECFTVGVAAVGFVSTSTRPASCSDGEDGVIRLVIANGVQPYTVRVEPLGLVEIVGDSEIEVMVPPGTYDVFVTDNQGAMLTTEETVAGPAAISAVADLTSDTENDGCSGMISLDIADGATGYTVDWNSLQSGTTISMLCAGDYVATITNASGCTITMDTLTIGRIDERLDAVTDVACDGGTDGRIDVTISGGAEPYTYAWVRAGTTETVAATEDLTEAEAGDYQLTITDATGATLVRNYTIGIAAGFTVSTSVTSGYNGFNVSCNDSADGEAVAVISGRGDFDFEWFLNDISVDTDSILNDAPAGRYLLIVTSAGGCVIERTVALTAPDALSITADVTDISCGGTVDGAITATPAGGIVGTYEFEWANGSSDRTLLGLGQDTYGLTVTDANDCVTEASYTLATPGPITFTFEAKPATEGCNGSIEVIALSGTEPFTYNWLQLPNQRNNPLAEGLCPGEYTVEVTDANGCHTQTMIARVEDRRFPCLSTRDVITPNGDGLNESFVLFCSEDETVSNNNLEIYNRWGQLVYNTTDYDCSADDGVNCFEGRTNDGSQLPAGPYYYIFNYTNEFMEQRQQRGSLTIVRD